MKDVTITPYDDAKHRAFVMSNFACMCLTTWPWSVIPLRELEPRFVRELRHPENRALMAVLTDDPDAFCGWVLTKPHANEIVAGYTRRPLRRKWGIGSSLAIAGGIDFERPVGVWFWTYATERLFREHAGYGRLYHKVTDEEDRAR